MKVKYPSIENSYREKNLDWIRTIVPKEELWEVTEKIHGSNCFIYKAIDLNGMQIGKRKGFLKPNQHFYNYQRWFDRDADKFISLFNHLRETIHHVDQIVGFAIFGEIFGGNYPHPDIIPIANIKRVQKGIFYTPSIEFYAFDIAVYYKNEDYPVFFLGMERRNFLFEKHKLFYAKPLIVHDLGVCLTFNPVFESLISSKLGFPTIENNFAEGVVIKPVNNYFFANGNRVILKNKHPDHEGKSAKKAKVKKVLPDHLQLVFETLCQYITEARFHNVESHEGKEFEFKDFNELRGLYLGDLLKDFFTENDTFEIDEPDWKLVNQFLGKEVNNNLRVWLKR